MTAHPGQSSAKAASLPVVICALLVIAGGTAFVSQAMSGNAARAWLAYLLNFLLFSAMAHGALLFSTLMHAVRARWSGPLADLAHAFSAFFPISLLLFLGLLPGSHHIFTWLGHDLHGRQSWLNLPFLFARDLAGLLILYTLGLVYLYHALWFRVGGTSPNGFLGRWLQQRWQRRPPDAGRFRRRMTVLGLLYMLAFAIVMSLLGYDLVMAMDPHWYSTLFGAYSFVKAIYVGFGALIVLAAVLHLRRINGFNLKSSQFHDIGKLFFAFCLVWADFFYAQFVVIWYGNIPEETAYIIERTMTAPWKYLAYTVFVVCFVAPFLILLNKKIKTVPAAMLVICCAVIVGMWLEHFLLLGPVFFEHAATLPLSWIDATTAMGFLGLLMAAITVYLRQFPGVLRPRTEENR